MAKLNTSEKFERKTLKNILANFNGQMFTDEDFGTTVVVVPACGRSDSEFVHVTVAQCSPGDVFKRKRGELLAMQRWNDAQYLSVRRNGRCLGDVADDMVGFLTM